MENKNKKLLIFKLFTYNLKVMPNAQYLFTVHGSLLRRKLFLFLLLPLLLATNYLLLTPPAFAQFQSTDISNVYDVTDTNAVEGDILISTQDQGLKLATTPYDIRLFGILQNQPLMVFRRLDNKGTPVARNGTAQVNVTTLGGPIKPGDYITSSEIPGKGQKTTDSGYIVGIALTSFEEKDGQKIDFTSPTDQRVYSVSSGKVAIALKIEFAEISSARTASRALDYFSIALFKNVQDPNKFVQVLRYIAAALTVLISLGVGFLTFSRSIPKGIEAIGRNPLAEKAILFSIVLNIIFTILTASVGIVVAVFILRL